jgi:hypothetical protein
MNHEIEYWYEKKHNYINNLKNNVGHKASITALLIKIDKKLDNLNTFQIH